MQGTVRIPEAIACRVQIPELRTQFEERRDLSASQFTVVDKGILWKVPVAAIGEPMFVEVGGEQRSKGLMLCGIESRKLRYRSPIGLKQ
jgi:hypothetical protein